MVKRPNNARELVCVKTWHFVNGNDAIRVQFLHKHYLKYILKNTRLTRLYPAQIDSNTTQLRPIQPNSTQLNPVFAWVRLRDSFLIFFRATKCLAEFLKDPCRDEVTTGLKKQRCSFGDALLLLLLYSLSCFNRSGPRCCSSYSCTNFAHFSCFASSCLSHST